MWDGLIGPNNERWVAGAKALQRAPLTVVAESGELGIADDVVLIRLFARRAADMTSPDDRAQLFGQLLGTCARCHSTIRDTGAP
jgi:cytochrome c553